MAEIVDFRAFDGLWLEEIVRHGFDAVGGSRTGEGLREILDDDPAGEVRVAGFEGFADLAAAAADVGEENLVGI